MHAFLVLRIFERPNMRVMGDVEIYRTIRSRKRGEISQDNNMRGVDFTKTIVVTAEATQQTQRGATDTRGAVVMDVK